MNKLIISSIVACSVLISSTPATAITSSDTIKKQSNINQIRKWQTYSSLIKSMNLNYNDSILDLSSENKNISNFLTKIGATKVYSFSTPQTQQKSNISASKNIYTIKEDFSKSSTVNKLLNQKQVGFIVGFDTLENWSANKIESELSRMNNGLKKGGKILFNIANPFIKENLNQDFYAKAYSNESNILINKENISDRAKLNAAIGNLAKDINKYFPNYEILASSYFYDINKRLALYPFEMVDKKKSELNNKVAIKHLLFPENMRELFKRAGFKNIELGTISNETNSFYISAVKG